MLQNVTQGLTLGLILIRFGNLELGIQEFLCVTFFENSGRRMYNVTTVGTINILFYF
jgi:hypothetical protein